MHEAGDTGRITLFARVDSSLNPYTPLYKRAIEKQGLTVVWEREFGLRWFLLRSRHTAVVHLHWIESAYLPAPRTPRSRLWRRMRRSRIVMTGLGCLALTNFLATLLLTRLAGKWIVYTANDLDAHSELAWPFPWLRWCAQRAVFRLAHRLHVHSRDARQTLHGLRGPRTEVRVIPVGNFVDSYPSEISRERARRRLNLRDDERVYLFFGLLRPYKRVEELIRAFEEMASPSARLLLVGKAYQADYAEHLEALCAGKRGITLMEKFIPDDEVQVFMRACDVCVFPYREATSSAAVMLALSFGRPVVAPSLGYFKDVIAVGTGILYDPTRPGALASAMAEAGRRSWSESQILGHAKRFDWEVLAPRLVRELYEKVAERA